MTPAEVWVTVGRGLPASARWIAAMLGYGSAAQVQRVQRLTQHFAKHEALS